MESMEHVLLGQLFDNLFHKGATRIAVTVCFHDGKGIDQCDVNHIEQIHDCVSVRLTFARKVFDAGVKYEFKYAPFVQLLAPIGDLCSSQVVHFFRHLRMTFSRS